MNILNICRHGGIKLIGVKLLVIAVFSVGLTLLFSLSPLIVLNFTTGLSNPFQYIQALDIFQFCPYMLAIWQYLVIFILVKAAVFLLFALFVAVLGQLLDNEIFVFSASFVFLVANYLLSLAGITSPLFFLQKFNFFELAFVNVLFDRYRALNIFNYHVGFLIFTITLVCVIFVVLILISLKFKLKGKSKLSKSREREIKLANSGVTSILEFEFRKNLLNKKGAMILIAAIAAKIILVAIYFTPLSSDYEITYKNYIADLSGEIDDSKAEYIKEEREYINKALAEHETAQQDYRKGVIDLNELQAYNQRYNYASSVSYAFERVEERYRYLLSMNENYEAYDNIEFIYEAGASKYLFAFFDIILVLLLLAIFADIFSGEYQSGFILIMSISKNGGKKTFGAKYLFGFITITALYFVFSAVDLFFLFQNFDMNYLNANIMSIPEFAKLEVNMSILNY